MSEAEISLDELRVLIVEDELLISMMLEEMLEDFGCSVVGPCADVGSALEMCRSGGFDVALVDMNLGGFEATPIIEVLETGNIPYALSTGAEISGADVPQLRKPFNLNDLQRVLKDLKQRRG